MRRELVGDGLLIVGLEVVAAREGPIKASEMDIFAHRYGGPADDLVGKSWASCAM